MSKAKKKPTPPQQAKRKPAPPPAPVRGLSTSGGGVMMGIRNRFQRVAATKELEGKRPWTFWQILSVVIGIMLILVFVLGMNA